MSDSDLDLAPISRYSLVLYRKNMLLQPVDQEMQIHPIFKILRCADYKVYTALRQLHCAAPITLSPRG